MFRKLLHILTAAYVLVGCNTILPEHSAEVGWLVVDFSCSDETKTGYPEFSAYNVSIKGISVDYIKECTLGDLPEILELVPGDYNISLSSTDHGPAVFDVPIYSSSVDFTIEADATRSVSMILSNVQVTLSASETFNIDTVESCTVTVSDGDASLIWSFEDLLKGRTGYFTGASVLYIELEGRAKNGNMLKYNDIIYDVKPSQHHRITFGEAVL